MNIVFDEKFILRLLNAAENSKKKRSHYNIHKSTDEPVQRLCIALNKGTYIRPHHHPEINKWEMTVVLKGRVALLIFDVDGLVMERIELSPGATCGIEINPDTWHTTFPLDKEAVILEVKEGPFIPIHKSSFALWAPKEGDEGVSKFLEWAEVAKAGDLYPSY